MHLKKLLPKGQFYLGRPDHVRPTLDELLASERRSLSVGRNSTKGKNPMEHSDLEQGKAVSTDAEKQKKKRKKGDPSSNPLGPPDSTKTIGRKY